MGAHFLWFGGIWGRKDAFPGADGSTIQQTTDNNATVIKIYGADGKSELTEDGLGYKRVNITAIIGNNFNTLEYSIKAPLTFIYNSAVPYDWYTTLTSKQNNTLWSEEGSKSIYDPCPRGWHIPSDGTWNDFVPTNFLYYIEGLQQSSGNYYASNGRLYNHCTWYPAAGRRLDITGKLNGIGSVGYYWSASTVANTIYTKALYFRMTDFYTSFPGSSRSAGRPARCVQE